jgi:hypothetical protein
MSYKGPILAALTLLALAFLWRIRVPVVPVPPPVDHSRTNVLTGVYEFISIGVAQGEALYETGTMTFDGHGGVTWQSTMRLGARTCDVSARGTYSLGADDRGPLRGRVHLAPPCDPWDGEDYGTLHTPDSGATLVLVDTESWADWTLTATRRP